MSLKIMFAFVISVLMGSVASAASITNTFDTGASGWTASGGALTWQSTGGNPGGYISINDTVTNFMQASSGSDFLGDLSIYDGGAFGFDAIQTDQGSGSYLAGFGTVELSGGGQTASLDVFTANPTSTWASASVSFDAATWGLSQTNWLALLSNVTSFQIEVESWNGVSETVGLDNITLTAAVPLPAGFLLLLTALGGLGLAVRRSAQS